MIQAKREAWTNPFVVVYEPSFENQSSVKNVSMLTPGNRAKHVALKVENKDNQTQYIFQGVEPDLEL